MPELKTDDLFVSHAWKYGDDYNRLVGLLDAAPNFQGRNYSVPKHDPAIDPNTSSGRVKLLNALDAQVKPVNCMLILGGMYAAYSYWIKQEIRIAKEYGKPIIAVYPWGQERMPADVHDAADEEVKWNTDSIVAAIRRRSI